MGLWLAFAWLSAQGQSCAVYGKHTMLNGYSVLELEELEEDHIFLHFLGP